jgi:hypothetical protein
MPPTWGTAMILQVSIALVAGGINRHQQHVITDLGLQPQAGDNVTYLMTVSMRLEPHIPQLCI